MLRRFHRVLGAVMVLPLVLWTVTGLLFLVKPGWSGAYEGLDPWRGEALAAGGLVPLETVLAGDVAVVRAELGDTALGPLYRMSAADGSRWLVDAQSGERVSPLEREAALAVATDAAGRARAAARYGAVRATREEGDALAVEFEGGATVTVGRTDLSLAQSGVDTERIDALYQVHYLQWTGEPVVDRVLALAGIVGTWVLAGVGVVLMRAGKK